MELKKELKKEKKLSLSLEKHLKVDMKRFLDLILSPADPDEIYTSILLKYLEDYMEKVKQSNVINIEEFTSVLETYNNKKIRTSFENILKKDLIFKDFFEKKVKEDICLFLKDKGLKNINDTLKIYREISLEEDYTGQWAEIEIFENSDGFRYDTRFLGKHWSYEESCASAIWGEDEGTKYLLKADANLKNIEIEHSFLLNYEEYEFYEEKEIRMKINEKLDNVEIFIAEYEKEMIDGEEIKTFKRNLTKKEVDKNKEFFV